MSKTGKGGGKGRRSGGRPMARRVSGKGGPTRVQISTRITRAGYEALNTLKVDRVLAGDITVSYGDIITESLLRMARGRRVVAGDDGAEADGAEADGAEGIHRQD